MTNCRQSESHKTSNYFLFSLPLTIQFSVLFSRTLYSEETDENSEQTLSHSRKTSIFCSRTVKAAKHKAKTEATRAQLCKRCLFPPSKNKENKTSTSAEPPILGKNSHDPQDASGEIVSPKSGNWVDYLHLFFGLSVNKKQHKLKISTSRQHHSHQRAPGAYKFHTRVVLGATDSGIG